MSIIKESDIPKVTPVVVRTKAEIMQVIRDNLENFKLFGVIEVGLFGSFVREEATKQSDSESYLIRTKQQEELDITIAKDIIKQYPNKFQHIAIAEVKDIISASDRALELGSNSENISPTDYVTNIINRSVPQQNKDKNQLTFE
jgi:predicted nucleotidyltransferase